MKISVKAHPKSKKILVEEKDQGLYEVWVREAPEKGRANQAVLEALSDYLNIPISRLSVDRGHNARHKIIEILPGK